MTFESEGLLIVAIYIWLQLASYVVFVNSFIQLLLIHCNDCIVHL